VYVARNLELVRTLSCTTYKCAWYTYTCKFHVPALPQQLHSFTLVSSCCVLFLYHHHSPITKGDSTHRQRAQLFFSLCARETEWQIQQGTLSFFNKLYSTAKPPSELFWPPSRHLNFWPPSQPPYLLFNVYFQVFDYYS
jgi:hypothetical protein